MFTQAIQSSSNYTTYLKDFIEEEPKDFLDFFINILEAVPLIGKDYFSKNSIAFSEKLGGELEQFKRSISIRDFFVDLLGFNKEWADFSKDNTIEENRPFIDHTTKTVLHGSDSLRCLHEAGIVNLKKNLEAVKGAFFGALFVLCGVDAYYLGDDLQNYQKQIDGAKTSEIAAHFAKRITLTHMKRAENIAYVALSALCLVSIFFASLANGLLFSAGALLGISSVGLAFMIASFFYEKVLDQEAELLGVS